MRRAGITVATVGVFAWAKLEPIDGTFPFDWLDDILDRLHRGGIAVTSRRARVPSAPLAIRA